MNKFYYITDKTSKIEYSKIFSINNRIISKYFSYSLSFRIAQLIAYSPMGEEKEKIFFKLKIKQRKGFLIRYIIRCANKYNIPKTYIEKFIKEKDYYSNYIKNDKIHIKTNELTEKLYITTITLVSAILDNIKSSTERKKKLDNIFFN